LLAFLITALPIFVVTAIVLRSGQRVSELSELKERSSSRVGPLKLGMSQRDIVNRAGSPDLECHDQEWLLDGYLLESLKFREITKVRWLYFLEGKRKYLSHEDCRPEYNDTILGFDENGQLIWYVRFSGESDFVGIKGDLRRTEDDP